MFTVLIRPYIEIVIPTDGEQKCNEECLTLDRERAANRAWATKFFNKYLAQNDKDWHSDTE